MESDIECLPESISDSDSVDDQPRNRTPKHFLADNVDENRFERMSSTSHEDLEDSDSIRSIGGPSNPFESEFKMESLTSIHQNCHHCVDVGNTLIKY
jgi:hypothetical protein